MKLTRTYKLTNGVLKIVELDWPSESPAAHYFNGKRVSIMEAQELIDKYYWEG